VTATAAARLLALDQAAQDLLFREARTPNAFTPEPVTDEQVRAIYDLVKYAPTSMNQQPLRIVLVRSAAARQRLVRHMAGTNAAKVSAAPLVALLAADYEFHEKLPRLFPHRPEVRELFADRSVREQSARFNATLQIAYFILGVRAAGLAAGPIVGFDAERVDREFFGARTPRTATVLTVVNVGKPAENAWLARLPRLAFHEAVSTV
jgi:3-hydroxypropanoate dehydrogenase